jgi:hypothetical protein
MTFRGREIDLHGSCALDCGAGTIEAGSEHLLISLPKGGVLAPLAAVGVLCHALAPRT